MISFEEFMKEDEEYIHMLLSFDIEEIAEAFRADEKFVRKCFRNGHYSRGILAAALCEKLNRTEDPTYEVFGDGETYYDVDYKGVGEEVLLVRKDLQTGEEEKCYFYDLKKYKDLKLKNFYIYKLFDGESIFANTQFFPIVCFYVPCWF